MSIMNNMSMPAYQMQSHYVFALTLTSIPMAKHRNNYDIVCNHSKLVNSQ
jgi:hypothetical protein